MNGECVSGGGRKRIPGKQRQKASRQFLGVLDFFRVFLEVKSPVKRNVYFKALGIHCSSGLWKECSMYTSKAARCQKLI